MAEAMNVTSNVTSGVDDSTAFLDYVGYVLVPLLFIMGVVGNALTIRIMLTNGLRSMPVSKVLIALSVSDTIVNIMLPFNKSFVHEMIGVDIRAMSLVGCKFFYWTYRVFKFPASWMVVLISTERFIAVWLPIKAKSISTKRNAYIAIAIAYGYFAVYIGYWTSISDNIINGRCIPNAIPPEMKHVMRGILVFGVIMYVNVPAIILIFLNTMIVYKLIAIRNKKNKTVVPAVGTGQGDTKKQTQRDVITKTNAMLVCVAVAFIILETPIGILHMISFSRNQSLFLTKDREMVILREIAQVMEQLNHSINFLLYVLASKGFRDRVVAFFTGKISRFEHGQSVTEGTVGKHTGSSRRA
jgi:hypothetical protein